MSDSSYLKCSCTQCGGHIEFPAEVAGTEANCPHCNQPTRLQAAGTPAPRATPAPPAPAAPTAAPRETTGATSQKRPVRTPRPSPAFAPTPTETPEPGEPRPQRNWLKWVGIVVLVAMIPVAVISWIPKKIRGAKGGRDTIELTGPPGWQKSPDSGLIFIKGAVTNFSDRPYFSVKIEFDLLNQNGTPVGVASDYVPVVDAHKIWFFKALVTDPDARSFKLIGLKAER